MYPKRTLLDVGGFNHKLPGAEDSELNSRLIKKGELFFVPKAVVCHDHVSGLRDFANQMLRYGRDKGIVRKFSIAVAPSLFLILLLLSLIFTPWLFIISIFLYSILILLMGVKFALQKKNVKFIISIPLVYVTEHILYSIGFWKGLILQN